MTTTTPKFNPGRVVITAALHAEIRRQGMEETVLLMPYLDRHCSGDWGETDEHDKRMNDDALKNGARIISAYDVPKIGRIWIITDGTYDEDQDAKQREVTTVMFPSDY